MARTDLENLAELARQVVAQAAEEDKKVLFPGSTVADVQAVLQDVQAANRGMACAIGVATGDPAHLRDVPDQELSALLAPLRDRARRLEQSLSSESFPSRAPASPRAASGRAFRAAVASAAALLPPDSKYGAPLAKALGLVTHPGEELPLAQRARPPAQASSSDSLMALARLAENLAQTRAQSRADDKQKKALAGSLKAELITAAGLCRDFALLVAPDAPLASFPRSQVEAARDTLEAGRDKVLAQVAVRMHCRNPSSRAGASPKKSPRSPGGRVRKLTPENAKRARRSSHSWGRAS